MNRNFFENFESSRNGPFQKRYNLDRNEALHHCTLLVNANIEVLNKVLKSKDPRIETAATRSLRVDVKCLSDIGISDPTHMDKVRDLLTELKV